MVFFNEKMVKIIKKKKFENFEKKVKEYLFIKDFICFFIFGKVVIKVYSLRMVKKYMLCFVVL